jgi:hypothetical protein
MQLLRWRLLAAVALAFAPPALAQTAPAVVEVAPPAAATPPSITPPIATPSTLHLSAGTQIEVEFVDALSSHTSHSGDTFAIRLAEPIYDSANVALAPGALGRGEVIDAAPSGFGGHQGKLVVSGRYLEINGQQVRINHMGRAASGQDRTQASVNLSMVPYAGIAAWFISGGEIEIPAGTRAEARIAADVDVPLTPPAPPEVRPPTQSVATPTTTGEHQ